MNYIFTGNSSLGTLLWHKAQDASDSDLASLKVNEMSESNLALGIKKTNCGLVVPGVDHTELPVGQSLCPNCDNG